MSTDLTVPELISPEGLQVAQVYLQAGGSISQTAEELDMPIDLVQQHLDSREVINYVDRIYEESGFRNKHKVGAAMDAIIAKKLEEMDETELGSSKDIAELLQIQHKMYMEHMNVKIKLLELEKKAEIQNQTNVQVNTLAGGEGYNDLMKKLVGG